MVTACPSPACRGTPSSVAAPGPGRGSTAAAQSRPTAALRGVLLGQYLALLAIYGEFSRNIFGKSAELPDESDETISDETIQMK